jgi:hypothetical protein
MTARANAIVRPAQEFGKVHVGLIPHEQCPNRPAFEIS